MNTSTTPQLIIISGLSGSGKSFALKTFEDRDYYCVDNLPVDLLLPFIHNFTQNESGLPDKLAVGIDVRNRNDFSKLPQWVQSITSLGVDVKLLFFEADDSAIIRRYADTRRRHPLSRLGFALTDAIHHERQLTLSLREKADCVIDTSALNVHQLRRRLVTEFDSAHNKDIAPTLLFQSFAYKNGIPSDADFVFDTRVLPNPHWDPSLRAFTGRDNEVQEYFQGQPEVSQYIKQVSEFLDTWLPRLREETRSYITIAFGCTGGKHRSVYLAETLAQHATQQGWPEVTTFHRELG